MDEGRGSKSNKIDVGSSGGKTGEKDKGVGSGGDAASVGINKGAETKEGMDQQKKVALRSEEPMEVDVNNEGSKSEDVGKIEIGKGQEIKAGVDSLNQSTSSATTGGTSATTGSVTGNLGQSVGGTESDTSAASSGGASPAGEKSIPEQVNSTGGKDNEGFLPPPPASTLLIRRSRVGSTGATTYVVSPSTKSIDEGSPSTSVNGEQYGKGQNVRPEAGATAATPVASSANAQKSPASGGKPTAMNFQTVKRRPGRPVGSVGKYKKRVAVEPTSEVRTSERARARYDYDSPAVSDDSPWIYPTNFRASYLSGGKPPMTGNQGGYSKGKKHGAEAADNTTGKRKYMRRKKYGFDKRSYYREEVEQGDQSVQSQHLSDKGIWRPTDDLRLIINTIATGDLESVYVGVKFSCFFSYKEIEERWRKLMYGEKASLVAQNAINGLHPYVKAKIYYECLFSAEEEKLISTIEDKHEAPLDIKAFQTLLDDNPHVFNKYRTARSLMMHWQDMKDYHLHPNQDPLKFKPSEHFDCFESLYNCDIDEEDDLEEPDDPVIEQEIQTEDRSIKKHIRLLEDETDGWQKLVDQMMQDGIKDKSVKNPFATEFDDRTYAVLKGKDVHFAMASREIVIGRATPESKVDANLVEDSSCRKISRKQAVIRLKGMGRFVIINKGTHPIFVDRKIVPFKCAARLHDHSVIQFGPVGLIFIINRVLIDHIVEQDMQREIYESFKDLEEDYPPLPTKTGSTPTAASSSKGMGKLGLSFATGLESSGILQTKIKSAAKFNASPLGVSFLPPEPRSHPSTSLGSNFLNLDAALTRSELSSTVSKPAAAANVINNTNAAVLDEFLESNFSVPIITSVSSLSQPNQENVNMLLPSATTSGQSSLFNTFSGYSVYIPQSNTGTPTTATFSKAKP